MTNSQGVKIKNGLLLAYYRNFSYLCMPMKHTFIPKAAERKRLALTVAAVVCLCLTVQAQMDSRLGCRRYTTQDGLPQMQTERLWQDSRGYIYVGTLSGFARFDGHEFMPFLKGRRFNIVGFAETEGLVWAYDFRRQWLVGRDDVQMKPLDPQGRWLLNNHNAGSLPNGYLLLEDEQEEHRRLCRVTTEGWVPVVKGALLDGMTPDRKLFVDSTAMYVPTQDGLWKVTDGRRAVRLSAKGDVFTLLRTGGELLAFAADGIYTVGSKGLTRKTPFAFRSTNYGLIVRQSARPATGRQQDRMGHLMIADEHTLYEYDGSSVKEIASGFNLVKDLLIDKWDRLWAATYEGLYCFFNCSFTNHRLTDDNDIVRAIAVDGSNRLVMGTLNGKVLVGDTIVEDRPDNYYSPCAVTIGGDVYLACNGDVVRYDGTLHPLHLPYDRYQFVAKAGDRLVVGSRKSVCAYHPATGAIDTLSTAIPYPWCAAEDGQGTLWVGTTFGLFADGQKKDYRQKLIVTTMERDTQGNIVFASKDSLYTIRNGQVEQLPMPGLTGHEVRALHVSPKGFLTVAVIDGLFVSRISQDYTVSDCHFFDHTNGFTTLEPLMATMAESSDGTIWLAGIEEVTSFQPEALLLAQQEDTYIAPPLLWWQHWWVWLLAFLLAVAIAGGATWWYVSRRSRHQMIRLQREKLVKVRQIRAIRQKAIDANSTELSQDIVKMTEREDERMSFRTVSGTLVINTKDIAYFKGDGNYSQIVTFHGKDTVLMGLGALEKILNPDSFVRIDRSTVVNIHNISNLLPKQRRCLFRSAEGVEVEATLLAPAFKRLEALL